MIERVRLLRYKGFEDFDLRLGRQAVLVGPNNAGKTTLVQSLRLAASLLRFARRRNPYEAFEDDVLDKYPRNVLGYPIAHVGARELSWYKDENLRHEFRNDATGLVVGFKSKACLRVVWPANDAAFFYIDKLPGLTVKSAAEVRSCVPTIGVVPTLLPVEEREEVLEAHYVWESVGTRRTSRHFRNQLYHTRDKSTESFESFISFAVGNTLPEIVGEANKDAVVWVDRTRRRSRRAGEPLVLQKLNAVLGSGFNLGLARALRSRVALFVEGEDMKVLRNVARAVGAESLRNERNLAVIRLGGFSNWHQVEPFAWLSRDLLGNAVKIYVLLDRDYREDANIDALRDTLKGSDVHVHVWHRKEIESYLLVPEAIARASGLKVGVVEQLMETAIQSLRLYAQASFISRRQQDAKRGIDFKTIALAALPEFEHAWDEPRERIKLVPPKDALAAIAREAQVLGARPVSARSISAAIRGNEVEEEMSRVLLDIEYDLNTSI